MNFHIRATTRQALSLSALALPLVLLALSACGGGYLITPSVHSSISIINGQAAQIVIGQTSFTSSAVTGATETTFTGPYGNAVIDPATGKLYIADYSSNRIAIFDAIPAINGASAVLAYGQMSLTTSAAGTSPFAENGPLSPAIAGSNAFFADRTNNRVGVFSSIPTNWYPAITAVAGQTTKYLNAAGCTASAMNAPRSVSSGGGKMVVADTGNHRVLIWNAIPVTDGIPADIVLGQSAMTACLANAGNAAPTASSLNFPTGVWTDGNRLVVLDTLNNRVLIWKSFPSASNQPADLVLGQPGFTTAASGVSASTLFNPYDGIFVDSANQLFVTDTLNNRVLVWNTFPTTINQPADHVLGQINFSSNVAATSATGLNQPNGVTAYSSSLIVTDSLNNRVLVY